MNRLLAEFKVSVFNVSSQSDRLWKRVRVNIYKNDDGEWEMIETFTAEGGNLDEALWNAQRILESKFREMKLTTMWRKW